MFTEELSSNLCLMIQVYFLLERPHKEWTFGMLLVFLSVIKNGLQIAEIDTDNRKSWCWPSYIYITELSPTAPAPSPFKDIFLNGKVTWVGKSSMECTMHMDQVIYYFTLVFHILKVLCDNMPVQSQNPHNW